VFEGPTSLAMQSDGIEIALDAITHTKYLKVMLDGNDAYELQYRLGTEVIAESDAPSLALGLLHTRVIATPKAASERGFDRLVIRPTQGDGLYAVGYLRLR